MAEISVPAWPIPIHQTKLVMAKPHSDGNVDAPDADALGKQQRHGHRKKQQQREADRETGEPEQRSLAGEDDGAIWSVTVPKV